MFLFTKKIRSRYHGSREIANLNQRVTQLGPYTYLRKLVTLRVYKKSSFILIILLGEKSRRQMVEKLLMSYYFGLIQWGRSKVLESFLLRCLKEPCKEVYFV